jgi:lambda repressor-like predicted transcriptional regulator
MSAFKDKFDRKHEAAIAALLHTTTVRAAAQQAGVSERTLSRWLERADFQAAYRRAKRELIAGAVHILLHATSSATQVLVSIMNDATQPATARVSAARTVLTMVLHALHDEDLDGRFAEIEAQLAEVNGHHG